MVDSQPVANLSGRTECGLIRCAGKPFDTVGDGLVLGHFKEIHGSKYGKYNADDLIIFRFRMSTKFDE